LKDIRIHLGLWSFNSDTSLTSDSSDGYFAHSAEKSFVGSILSGILAQRTGHYVFCSVTGFSTSQVSWEICPQ
jgi:hypothetical protein